MPLKKVVARVCGLQSQDISENLFISGLAYDSRDVQPGDAFFCLPGSKTDGNLFVIDAIHRGASAIFSESEAVQVLSDRAIPIIKVDHVRLALAQAADCFFDSPSKKLRLLGVTGTNGKTTTTHLVEHIFAHSSRSVGLIGTLGSRLDINSGYSEGKHTTPQASDLQELLFQMKSQGISHVSMEVSSHALSLKRVAECDFALACLTNLTQDHLDFHKTMDHYFAAKQLLFEQLNNSSQDNRHAVINLDDPYAERFIATVKPPVKVLTYAFNREADAYVKNATLNLKGTELQLVTPDGPLSLSLKLHGRFNVYNVLAALLICLAEGISLMECKKALESFCGVAGRFEVVTADDTAANPKDNPLCLVDYAHTPDGLANILTSARALLSADGRLITVFGCGGDRDVSKRPQMGRIAEELADEVFVTSDNPRTEDPQKIIAEILSGIQRLKNIHVDPDRAEAIKAAVLSAKSNDIIVIAGKGHEHYQILAGGTIDFDDRLAAKSALRERHR